jgi:tRNA modification GTPase
MSNDTIVARASAAGKSGIAVIRISGFYSKAIAEKIFKKTLLPRVATFSKIYDYNDSVIDEGIGILFNEPNSFTGEDVVEIHCHGSPTLVDMVIETILKNGAKLARAGEFTERAFLNGKIDLLQAEAIADLIDSQSRKEAKAAIKTLEGEFSKKIQKVVNMLLNLRTEIEASLDFTEEDITFITKGEILRKLDDIASNIKTILKTAIEGSKLKEGIILTIAGEPNVGKSTLINVLSQEALAIVTDQPGTTRDVIRNQIILDGINYHISDTAGIREKTTDIIEEEGIKRTYKEINSCDYLLWVEDIRDPNHIKELKNTLSRINNLDMKVIVIKNKCDLVDKTPELYYETYPTILLSAKDNQGVDLLIDFLKKDNQEAELENDVFIARRRHIHALEKALEEISLAQEQININMSFDLLAYNLKVAQDELGVITGLITTEDLLTNIFNSFCVGK